MTNRQLANKIIKEMRLKLPFRKYQIVAALVSVAEAKDREFSLLLQNKSQSAAEG